MRFATVRLRDGQTRAARVLDGGMEILPYADLGAFLSDPGWRDAGAGSPVAADEVDYVQLVSQPSKVFCVGLNYLLHVREGGGEVPSYPTLFAKFADALTGPFDDIVLTGGSEAVDWEAELVVVIGDRIRNVDRHGAESAIAGFSVGNDVSMRDWQRRTLQWLQGKTWEASSPVGPVMVTPDEVGGTGPDLRISCRVDGQTMQDARTSDLLFDSADVVSYISTFITLRPGDLIFTGTPEGVGFARTPPIALAPGQVVETEIEGIGTMVNRFI